MTVHIPPPSQTPPINPPDLSPAPADPSATRLSEIQSKLDAAEQALENTRRALAQTEQRHAMDLALLHARTIDLEAARAIINHQLQLNPQTDPSAAVKDLQRTRPWLFSQPPAPRAAAMGANPAPHPDPLNEAAQRASQTGDRRALLGYLRIRRQTA